MVQLELAALGFLVGVFVGALGVGGGVLMTPALIILGVPPVNAVGSDLLYSTASKAFASLLYGSSRSVSREALRALVAGALPALALALVAYRLLAYSIGIEGLNRLVKISIGAILLAISAYQLTKPRPSPGARGSGLIKATGFLTGLTVFFTSVGSGSVVTAVLMRFIKSHKELVGTSIAYSFLLTGLASIPHTILGNVAPSLTLALLVGSLPGVYIGYLINDRTPREPLLLAVTATVGASGFTLLATSLL